jgi:NTP pyrophosphatase (non-canonical NTP hydrolase)
MTPKEAKHMDNSKPNGDPPQICDCGDTYGHADRPDCHNNYVLVVADYPGTTLYLSKAGDTGVYAWHPDPTKAAILSAQDARPLVGYHRSQGTRIRTVSIYQDTEDEPHPLTLNEYQQFTEASDLGNDIGYEEMTVCCALGLAGEAGKVADIVKKWRYHNKFLEKEALAEEMGYVLWYLASLARSQGFSLQAVAKYNIEKLKRRYPNGFKPEENK